MEWINWRKDLIASVVVFLVAIPLCLGIALASDAPPFAGIVTGIIGGIVVGAISGSRVSVSGPAAGMIAVVLASISVLGSYENFLLALLLAGLLQIVIGAFRAGFIADYIPSNVIKGLLAAIGILIIIKQLPLALGYMIDSSEVSQNLKVAQETFHIEPLLHLLTHISVAAMLISGSSLIILMLWSRLPKKISETLPAAMVAVLFAVLLNQTFVLLAPGFALSDSHLVNIPVNESFHSIVMHFQHPNFSSWQNINIYIYAAMIAAVASLETLLNLEAAEKMDPHHRYSSRNRELIAQGVGNMASGMIGGLPITSVIIRSAVNIQSQASSKGSTILHGTWLLFSLLFIPQLLNKIPIASLAAILIFTGYKLASIDVFKKMYRQDFAHFFPFVVTIVGIVFTNLLLGVLIGLTASFFFILRQNSKNRLFKINEKHASGDALRLMLPQQLTFLSKAAVIRTLDEIKPNTKVILDANQTTYIDQDILNIIEEFKSAQSVEKKIQLNLEGFKSIYRMADQINFVNVTTSSVQAKLTPAQVLSILHEGNQRFMQNTPIHKNFSEQISNTIAAQHPIAVVLSCIDSRVPIEFIFDTNLGDVFVIRIAGNVVNQDILGSLEFACHVAGAKLILVLGHEHCGAIQAACNNVTLGHLTQLLEKIKPAINQQAQSFAAAENKSSYVSKVTACNVALVKQYLYQNSDILQPMIDDQKIALVGAMYDIGSGMVHFENNAFYNPTHVSDARVSAYQTVSRTL